MAVPFIDLKPQNDLVKQRVMGEIDSLIDANSFILGRQVSDFESTFASSTGADFAIGVNSGTDALIIALHAAGIGEGDEVIVPSFTFFATVEAVMRVGATPVFADIDPRTFCIDSSTVEKVISSKTVAILPVHVYGYPVDTDLISQIDSPREIKIIGDSAQAFGASRSEVSVGALGDASCFSFFPTKPLSGFGDGGMIVTNNEEMANQARLLARHGAVDKYNPVIAGYNSRLDSLQAAVLSIKIKHADMWMQQRKDAAMMYASLLQDTPLLLPFEDLDTEHAFHLYTVLSEDRDSLRDHLMQRGVGVAVYYQNPLHLTDACAGLNNGSIGLDNTMRASERCISLPMYAGISGDQIEEVAAAVIEYFGGR
jgi:dTDP-4-amino-4,6-dideoxygalactose transaminase